MGQRFCASVRAMSEPNCETRSVLKQVMYGTGRLTWYACHCKKRGMSYQQFVEELETLRRDIVRTADNVVMNPETNDNLEMPIICAAWAKMRWQMMVTLYSMARILPRSLS